MLKIDGRKAFWLVLISAVLLRIIFVLLLPLDAPDTASYDNYALQLLSGHGFSDNLQRPPGYPLFLVFIYSLFGHSFTAVRICQAVLDAGTCLLVYLLGARIFRDRRKALLGAALAAVNLSLIASTSYVLTETLTAFLLTAAVILLVAGWSGKDRRRWFLAGLLVGAVTMTRPVTLIFPVFLFLAAVSFFREKVRNTWLVGFFCLGMVLPILPWTVRNVLVYHRFIPVAVGTGFNVWVGSYLPWNGDYNWRDLSAAENLAQGLSQIDADRKFMAEGIRNIRQNPAAYALLCFKKIGRFWLQAPGGKQVLVGRPLARLVVFGSQYLLLLLFLAGSFFACRDRNALAWIPLVMVCYFTFVHLFFLAIPRYHIPVLPLLAAMAGNVVRESQKSKCKSQNAK